MPPGLAQIAGRHHDPCEGTALNLLGIVHVACRLADALGYDVVKPLTPLDFDTVLAELPAGRVNLGKSSAELCAQIERSIAEYASEQGSPESEESLALLAAVAPEGVQPSLPSEALAACPESASKENHAVAAGNRRKK